MVMARSVVPRDEEYDFIEQPSRDFFCPVTFDVLLEPYQTSCCGNHLSETAYQQLQAQGKPCPVCKEEPLKAVKDKYHKRRVSSLKVRCPHKAKRCEWEGELGSLEQHLNANSSAGECRYVDVDCPYACGERVQRRSLEEHKSQRCPLRPFTCQYCNHKATHQKITKEHWPVCEKYPLPCPNECGEKEIERQHLKGHLEQTCPLEEIQCDFSYAGCGAQLQRRLMPAHVREGTDAHLTLLSLVAQKVPKLEDKIKQQEDKMKQQEDQIVQQGGLIKQIKELLEGQGRVLCMTTSLVVPPVEFTVENIERRMVSIDPWCSPPFYSYLGGYKMRLKVTEKSGVVKFLTRFRDKESKSKKISVCLMKGEFDDDLSWPLEGTLTLQWPLNEEITLWGIKPQKAEANEDYIGSFSMSDSDFRKHLKSGNLTLCVSERDVLVK